MFVVLSSAIAKISGSAGSFIPAKRGFVLFEFLRMNTHRSRV